MNTCPNLTELPREKLCCNHLYRAIQQGSDSYGFGRLFFAVSCSNTSGVAWHTGDSQLAHPNYCPWCGHELPTIEEVEV